MFISLSSFYAGNACGVRACMNYYKVNPESKGETHFFDWITCSMRSINEVLEGKEISFDVKSSFFNFLNTYTIRFNNFDMMISHHDLHEINNKEIFNLIVKYNRRRKRLIETIKNEKQIFFIRYCKDQRDLQGQEIIQFYDHVLRINPNLDVKFILASDNNNLRVPAALLNKKGFIFINLNGYKNTDVIPATEMKEVGLYKCIFTIANNIIQRTTVAGANMEMV